MNLLEGSKRLARDALRHVRRRTPAALFWCETRKLTNFGDLLGPYLFRILSGLEPVHTIPTNRSLGTVYLTVGSILHWCRDNCIVWGSGIVRRSEQFPRPHAVYATRGPYTRRRFLELGYPCPEVYGDPGLILPRVFRPAASHPRTPLGVVAHYVDKEVARRLVQQSPDVLMIDVFDPVERVAALIASCERVVSSSLHGVIIAHAYGVPAAWVKFSDNLWGDDVKFLDYFASVGIAGAPLPARIEAPVSCRDLAEVTDRSPQPDQGVLDGVVERLLATCPFLADSGRVASLARPAPAGAASR